MDADCLPIDVEHRPVAVAVDDRRDRVAPAIGNADVVEVDDGTEAGVESVCAVSKPNRVSRVPEVETEISKPVIDPFSNNIAIVTLGLAHHCKDGEVSHESGSGVGG